MSARDCYSTFCQGPYEIVFQSFKFQFLKFSSTSLNALVFSLGFQFFGIVLQSGQSEQVRDRYVIVNFWFVLVCP